MKVRQKKNEWLDKVRAHTIGKIAVQPRHIIICMSIGPLDQAGRVQNKIGQIQCLALVPVV